MIFVLTGKGEAGDRFFVDIPWFFISLSRQMLGMSFGVLVCVLLLTLAICFAGHLQVSVLSLAFTSHIQVIEVQVSALFRQVVPVSMKVYRKWKK